MFTLANQSSATIQMAPAVSRINMKGFLKYLSGFFKKHCRSSCLKNKHLDLFLFKYEVYSCIAFMCCFLCVIILHVHPIQTLLKTSLLRLLQVEIISELSPKEWKESLKQRGGGRWRISGGISQLHQATAWCFSKFESKSMEKYWENIIKNIFFSQSRKPLHKHRRERKQLYY